MNSLDVYEPGLIRRKHRSIIIRRRWRGVGRPSGAILAIAFGIELLDWFDILIPYVYIVFPLIGYESEPDLRAASLCPFSLLTFCFSGSILTGNQESISIIAWDPGPDLFFNFTGALDKIQPPVARKS
jgi:hypothetical protein